jgi:oligosaccharide reducing-end xylanase
MIREADGTRGRGMFDRENHLIRFVPEVDFTDPSYHLPHFYELFSQWAYPEDRTFFAKAASASRQYLHKACHELSGLCAEYSYYDGTPYEKGGRDLGQA